MQNDRHHRTKDSNKESDHKRERERDRDRERDDRRHDSGRDREREREKERERDRERTGSRHHNKESRYSDTTSSRSHNSTSASSSSYKSQSQQQQHQHTSSSSSSQRRSYDERSRHRRDSRSRSRSRSRTPNETPPHRRRPAQPSSSASFQATTFAQQSRKYRRRESRDSSSRSRSSPERSSAYVKRSGDVDTVPRGLLATGHQTSLGRTAPGSLAPAAVGGGLNAAAITPGAVAGGGGGGGGGLLPTPSYAPKIPSLMSLELNPTPMALAEPQPPALQLPKYYNPGIINANRYAEQQQKRKLIWGSKKNEDSANKWGNAHFSQDSDGKVASKFMRLMGIKNANNNNSSNSSHNNTSSAVGGVGGIGNSNNNSSHSSNKPDGKSDSTHVVPGGSNGSTTGAPVPADVQLRQRMFSTMEQQYEVARAATHTMRGVGLGFGSQPRSY